MLNSATSSPTSTAPKWKQVVVGAAIVLLFAGIATPLVMAWMKAPPDKNSVQADPVFAPETNQGRRYPRPSELGDGIEWTSSPIRVRQGGIVADIVLPGDDVPTRGPTRNGKRGPNGAPEPQPPAEPTAPAVTFGYNGLNHLTERVWLADEFRLLRLNPKPRLSAPQRQALDALPGRDENLVHSPQVETALIDFAKKIEEIRQTAIKKSVRMGQNSNGWETVVEKDEIALLDLQMRMALAKLPADQRKILVDDFLRRSEAAHSLFSPEQQKQVLAAANVNGQ